MSKRKHHNILSLGSGGSWAGDIHSQALPTIERDLNRPLHEVYDYIGCVSVGTIFGLWAALGRPSQEAADIFEDKVKEIFPKPKTTFRRFLQKFNALHSSKYDRQVAGKVYQEVFGKNTKLKDLKTRVGVLIWNNSSDKPPELVVNYPCERSDYYLDTDQDLLITKRYDPNMPLWRLALNATAAPLLFENGKMFIRKSDNGLRLEASNQNGDGQQSVNIDQNSEVYIVEDGATITRRIDLAALTELRLLTGTPLKNINVTSIGGFSSNRLGNSDNELRRDGALYEVIPNLRSKTTRFAMISAGEQIYNQYILYGLMYGFDQALSVMVHPDPNADNNLGEWDLDSTDRDVSHYIRQRTNHAIKEKKRDGVYESHLGRLMSPAPNLQNNWVTNLRRRISEYLLNLGDMINPDPELDHYRLPQLSAGSEEFAYPIEDSSDGESRKIITPENISISVSDRGFTPR
jgi:hypothetical protein